MEALVDQAHCGLVHLYEVEKYPGVPDLNGS